MNSLWSGLVAFLLLMTILVSGRFETDLCMRRSLPYTSALAICGGETLSYRKCQFRSFRRHGLLCRFVAVNLFCEHQINAGPQTSCLSSVANELG
jgi:hypothetical protein